MIIQGLNIEGDLVLRVPLEKRFPAGWDRFRWAWRALRGKPYERPLGWTVADCYIGKKLKEEWGLSVGSGLAWTSVELRNEPGTQEAES
ncbi:hypothetical protein LCGC14_0789920 [marine sediment metagenome]|uniref:Uncharacterized protein n=1 Tax=marine sediment metagenome TaxID=412755 RepID=A0A0F9QCQ9_9ZZZZ